jgi:hypothetical protein
MSDPYYTGPTRPWDFGRCFNDATDVLTKNIWILLLAGLVYEVLGAVTLLIFLGPLTGGMCVMTMRALRRRDRMAPVAVVLRAVCDRDWVLFVYRTRVSPDDLVDAHPADRDGARRRRV